MSDSASGLDALATLALAWDDLGHSLAMWPGLLQTMQRLLSKWHWHSSFMSLPSLPSFDAKSDFVADLLLDLWSFDVLPPGEKEVGEAEVEVRCRNIKMMRLT